jgi:hypothetical protein
MGLVWEGNQAKVPNGKACTVFSGCIGNPVVGPAIIRVTFQKKGDVLPFDEYFFSHCHAVEE